MLSLKNIHSWKCLKWNCHSKQRQAQMTFTDDIHRWVFIKLNELRQFDTLTNESQMVTLDLTVKITLQNMYKINTFFTVAEKEVELLL